MSYKVLAIFNFLTYNISQNKKEIKIKIAQQKYNKTKPNMQFTSNIIVALLLAVSTSTVTAAQKSANLRGDGSYPRAEKAFSDPSPSGLSSITNDAAGVTFTTFPPTPIPSGSVLCAGQIESDYCDCGFDCTANPSFCACDEAQTCCGSDEVTAGTEGSSELNFLEVVAESIGLQPDSFTVQGLHSAQGFVTESGNEINVEGMRQDCENINLNRKLATDFRSDFFGDGLIGFFDHCELDTTTNKNLNKFTLSSTDKLQLERVCNNRAPLPIVYDSQHDTYWIDEPFNCTQITMDEKKTSSADSICIGSSAITMMAAVATGLLVAMA